MPNELNYTLPWLLMGKIQKLVDTFYPNKKRLYAKKPYHANVPLKEPSGQITVDRPEGGTIAMPWFDYPRRYVSHFTLLIYGHRCATHCTDLLESEPHIMFVVYFSLHVCRM